MTGASRFSESTMVNEAKLDPHSFDQAYAVLKRNADFLSQQQESSIDQLLPLVSERMKN